MRNMGSRGRSGQCFCLAVAICLAANLAMRPDSAVGGPCYSLYPDVYCTQCPAASCDPACDAYGTYNPCECDPFPCDPPACTCSPPEDDGVAVCIDPPATWIGLHAKYIVAFGSEFEWSSPDPLFAGFLAGDQPETCFDKACDDLSRNAITQCIDSEELTRTIRSFVPVPGGQVEFNVWAIEPDTYFLTSVLSSIEFCTGGALYSGWPGSGSFYAHPILAAEPAPSGSPGPICQGTAVRLIPSFYCNEAYLFSTGNCFDLYKKCPPDVNDWIPIDFGDALGSALRSGCEIWAVANRPGSDHIILIGEDTWGRQRDAPLLYYEVVPKCPECGGPETPWIDMSFLVDRSCYPNETWDSPIILAEDDCGNEFSVTCTNGEFVTSMNDGICIWTCGINWWAFKRTSGLCGTRISRTFHRTQDLVSTCDRGTCNGVYDFVDTFTACDRTITSPGCCAAMTDPKDNADFGCPFAGDCDDSACGPCWCP